MAPLKVALPGRSPVNVTPATSKARPKVPLADRLLLNDHELAELTGVSVPTLRDAVVRGGLPHLRLGTGSGRVMFYRPSVARWIEDQLQVMALGEAGSTGSVDCEEVVE